jgi:hypothetical protein
MAQAQVLTSLPRYRIQQKIDDETIRARRGDNGALIIDQASLLAYRETLFNGPPPPLPSTKKRGRPLGSKTKKKAEATP